MNNPELLKRLCTASGISGDESVVREIILSEITDCCDDIKIDNLGNIIAFKKGAQKPLKKLMISAHMDEVGFIVTSITNDGLIKFEPVGGIDRRVIQGKSVKIGKNLINGV
ncbi:MAG: M42 family peptidase, partial [Acutalibacteraceae bacterium]